MLRYITEKQKKQYQEYYHRCDKTIIVKETK